MLEYYKRLEPQFIYAYTKRLLNLGTRSTQRAESSHPMVNDVTNKHTPIRKSVKRISAKITSAQRESNITLNRKMEHHPILMDIKAFALLKGKIIHVAIEMISRKLDKAKLLMEKFNQQVSFGVAPNEFPVVESEGNRCSSKCELPMQFQLPCQCWLYWCVVDNISILILLIYPR